MGQDSGPAASIRVLSLARGLARAEFGARKRAITEALIAKADVVEELGDGYASRCPGADPWGQRVLDSVLVERECCSFFQFENRFAPDDWSCWLRIRGPAGTKAFIETVLASPTDRSTIVGRCP